MPSRSGPLRLAQMSQQPSNRIAGDFARWSGRLEACANPRLADYLPESVALGRAVLQHPVQRPRKLVPPGRRGNPRRRDGQGCHTLRRLRHGRRNASRSPSASTARSRVSSAGSAGASPLLSGLGALEALDEMRGVDSRCK